MYTIKDKLNVDLGKHVLAMFLNQELFWMNNKAINEFHFHCIWRIKQISEALPLLDLLNSSYPTQPHS